MSPGPNGATLSVEGSNGFSFSTDQFSVIGQRFVGGAGTAPVAVDDTASVAVNSTGNAIAVLANDSDPNGDVLTVTSVTQPANGTASVGTGGTSVLYTPNAGFTGADSFTYTVSDGALSATATVMVAVMPTGTGTLGDVDGDGARTIVDALLIAQDVAGLIDLDAPQP